VSTLLSPPLANPAIDSSPDDIEQEVQHLFSLVAQASPEARTQFVARLFQGMVSKVNATLSEGLIKAALSQTAPTKPSGSTGAGRKIKPWPGAGRRELKDVFDPLEGWNHFGQDAFYRVLYFEPVPILQMILAHPNMPPGPDPRKKATSATIAKLIIERLEKHFAEQS
jgi:hypothetical protein